ncbi:hypothetical protein FACS1894104_3540 [Actinomycetota bacterium]|nr:hypothetical protein FACS1894104_3540 [Actinomycetota bacterium]
MKPAHNLIIDIVALVVYFVAANPAITGLAIHEWLSLGLVVVLFIHCLVHVDWIVDTIKRHKTNASTANLALDVATLIVFMVVTVSGLMVSRHILPAMGLVAPGYFFWTPLHSISAKLLLALLLIHIVAHWKWLAKLFGRK